MSVKERLGTIESPKFAPRLYGIAALVTVIILSGIWLVARFTEHDLSRDLQSWREKLNLVAESRSQAVTDWVDGNFSELRALADNPSLQLYMTQLRSGGEGEVAAKENVDAAQKSYLRNLLLFTADRAGFKETQTSSINANVESSSQSGLAIFNQKHEFVVATNMRPDTRDLLQKQATVAPNGKENLIDIQKMSDGKVVLGFVVPVYSIQGEHNPDSEIGKVAGIMVLDKQLAELLKQPAVTEKTLENILARKTGNKIEFLSPLQDGSETLGKQITFEARKYAEAGLIQTTGNFLAESRDYRDKPVLATSREISGTPWVLISKIDRPEALVKSDQQRAGMVAFFFMLIAAIVLIIIAIWWYAHSKRSLLMSHHFKKMATQAIAQEELLTLVTNNQPEPIYIVDDSHIYRFANQKAAIDTGTSEKDLPGKSLFDVLGGARGEAIAQLCDKALKEEHTLYDTHTTVKKNKEYVIRYAFVPLAHIPIHTMPEKRRGVLVVEQDITKAVTERERRIETKQQLVKALVKLVDKRDPFAANHSALVSMIAEEVATDMQLAPEMVETTRVAGSLMNIGKIMIDPELLTKTGDLTESERKTIYKSMHTASEVLKGIDFGGPVAETLRQWQEKCDGTGPLGLKGDEILISARIVAVANAFIGMISPRSWRTAIPVEKASKFLIENSDTLFDRKIVVALINHVENHKGRAWIEQSVLGNRDVA